MAQRNKQEMYPLVEAWQSGDQSKGRFCKAHRIKVHTFNYWLSKYQMDIGQAGIGGTAHKFVSLELAPDPGLDGPLSVELSYANGLRVQLQGIVSVTYLADLIRIGL